MGTLLTVPRMIPVYSRQSAVTCTVSKGSVCRSWKNHLREPWCAHGEPKQDTGVAARSPPVTSAHASPSLLLLCFSNLVRLSTRTATPQPWLYIHCNVDLRHSTNLFQVQTGFSALVPKLALIVQLQNKTKKLKGLKQNGHLFTLKTENSKGK